jgi:hypothetical protein
MYTLVTIIEGLSSALSPSLSKYLLASPPIDPILLFYEQVPSPPSEVESLFQSFQVRTTELSPLLKEMKIEQLFIFNKLRYL